MTLSVETLCNAQCICKEGHAYMVKNPKGHLLGPTTLLLLGFKVAVKEVIFSIFQNFLKTILLPSDNV